VTDVTQRVDLKHVLMSRNIYSHVYTHTHTHTHTHTTYRDQIRCTFTHTHRHTHTRTHREDGRRALSVGDSVAHLLAVFEGRARRLVLGLPGKYILLIGIKYILFVGIKYADKSSRAPPCAWSL